MKNKTKVTKNIKKTVKNLKNLVPKKKEKKNEPYDYYKDPDFWYIISD